MRTVDPVRSAWILLAAAGLAAACRDGPGPPAQPVPAAARKGTAAPARLDLRAWISGSASDLGCRLERELGWHDPAWGCEARPPPLPDDPCDDGWAAGPQLPDAVARRLDPRLARVTLAWEHGLLQAATFEFDDGVAAADMPRLLGIGPHTLDGAAWHGASACPGPCYRVVAFAPSDECEDDEEDDDGGRMREGDEADGPDR